MTTNPRPRNYETIDLTPLTTITPLPTVDDLNRQHLNALNAQIIRLSNDKALLLAALSGIVNYSPDDEIWINGVRSTNELKRRRRAASEAIAKATK